MNEPVVQSGPSATPAKVVYFLYLASIIVGISGIVAVIVAYIYKSDAEPCVQTHYRFQIRTFWIGLLFIPLLIIGAMLGPVFFIVGVFSFVWFIVRCAKGLKYLSQNAAMPNPATWLF